MSKPKAPGKSCRKGITLVELTRMFPDEASARAWFEGLRWEHGRRCGHCGSENTKEVPQEKPMPYWCTDCRRYFSVKTGTPMQSSNIKLRLWAFAMYLMCTSLEGVSSMKLHRDLGISQKSAWFLAHRIRKAWQEGSDLFTGPLKWTRPA